MATIKSFTSLEQSKKLAEILPLESADMVYTITNGYHTPWIRREEINELDEDDVCAWSLAALIGVLPEKHTELIKEGGMYRIIIKDSYMTCLFDNTVDACCEMIIHLHDCDYGRK